MANKVVINDIEISGNYLLGGSIQTSHALAGETLAVDQFSCEVAAVDTPFIPADQDTALITADYKSYYAKSEIDFSAFKDGDEVFYYNDADLMGKYYFEEIAQISANRYKITAVSIIGRLLDSKHYGGIYVQTPAAQIFESILRGIPYEIDPLIASATVTGYLPIASRRDNLQQLLAATGSTVRIDNTGAVNVTSMSNVNVGTFGASRCYENGKVTTTKPVSGVKLTEHNYFEAGNVVTLFDDGVDGEELIEFKEPYHSLTIEGGEIVESGANYARIRASGAVVMTGKPYTHVTRVVTAGTVDAESTENVKTVSSCYLANPQVAQALADRFYSYLRCNKTISQDVLVGTERAGDVVSVINPYTMELESATIKRFDVTMSGRNKARAEFVVGFAPQGAISGFKNHEMLEGSGTWIVPDEVTKIRAILVAGGSGGSGGKKGADGKAGSWSGGEGYGGDGAGGTATGGTGGAGGAAGKSGSGGRVFEISMDVVPGETLAFSCGVGGAGGAANGGEGAAGTATTFGDYSSDYGRLYPYGYYEAKTGLTFSAAGADGYNGGAGGDGSATIDGETYGKDGEAVAGYRGGRGERSWQKDLGNDGRTRNEYSGVGGGGAAYGKAGGDAERYSSTYEYYSAAGNGAKASAGANATSPGQGGSAGSGGGGGGGGGVYKHVDAIFSQTYYYTIPGGSAGAGSKGGKGADGAIIIYY